MANPSLAEQNEQDLPVWNLKDLYYSKEDAQIDKDLQILEKKIGVFIENYNDVDGLNGQDFLQSIKDLEEISKISYKLAVYAELLKSTNMNDSDVAIFAQKIDETLVGLGARLIAYDLAVMKISDESLQQKMNEEKDLKFYKSWLKKKRLFKKYTLSEDVERVLQEKDITGRMAWVRLFDELQTSMRFDFRGEKVDQHFITRKMNSHDELERKDASMTFLRGLRENSDQLSMITNVLAKDKSIGDELRGFARPISSQNLSNMIMDDSVVDLLLQTIRKNYEKTSQRYFKIKAKIFGEKKLSYWNRSASYPDAVAKDFSWQEAKNIVLESYNKFSPQMGKMAQNFFDENWIDAKVVEGKRSGAFAASTFEGLHPFVLVNFQGKDRDVATLAHEIGHGIHFLFSDPKGILMSHAPLILSETASVFGEQITFRNMLDKIDDEKSRFYLLARKIEDTIATIIRQAMYCNFEIRVHGERKNGEISKERLGEIWMEENREVYGDAIDYVEDAVYGWSYIPHFIHVPFYVYAYAFGECFVNALYSYYQKNPKNFAEKYVEVLSAGSTLSYDEVMKKFGMNPHSEGFWQGSVDILIAMIEEMEILGKKIGIL